MCRNSEQNKKAIDEAKLKAITDRISKKKAEAIKGQRTTKQLDRPAISQNNKKRIVILPPPSAPLAFSVKRLLSPPAVIPSKKSNNAQKTSKK